MTRHIILLGFKHVGKSLLAKKLAKCVKLPYVDTDRLVEQLYATTYTSALLCREIFKTHGDEFFRDLEHQALRNVLAASPAVIALGGGTPLLPANQHLLKAHILIHITAPRELVFERIMRKGKPFFFVEGEDPWLTFNRLWEKRETIYQQLTTIKINNKGNLHHTLQHILYYL